MDQSTKSRRISWRKLFRLANGQIINFGGKGQYVKKFSKVDSVSTQSWNFQNVMLSRDNGLNSQPWLRVLISDKFDDRREKVFWKMGSSPRSWIDLHGSILRGWNAAIHEKQLCNHLSFSRILEKKLGSFFLQNFPFLYPLQKNLCCQKLYKGLEVFKRGLRNFLLS